MLSVHLSSPLFLLVFVSTPPFFLIHRHPDHLVSSLTRMYHVVLTFTVDLSSESSLSFSTISISPSDVSSLTASIDSASVARAPYALPVVKSIALSPCQTQAFEEADERFHRRAPIFPSPSISSSRRALHKNKAWVVYRGRKTGIFYNWCVTSFSC